MHYQGGKRILGPKIATEIQFYRKPGQVYLEPFVGALGVLQHVPGERVASDSNHALITLYQYMQLGWEPPQFIPKEEWVRLKATQDPHDPMTAYAGFSCAYLGLYYGNYHTAHAADGKARRELLRKMGLCKDVIFHWRDYRTWTPNNLCIYADPPYSATQPYKHLAPFDHNEFWDVMRNWSQNNTVLISEITAPDDFEAVRTFQTGRLSNGPKRVEHLFRMKR